MYTQDQQLEIAVAYAKSVSDKETNAKEFLEKINEMLKEFSPESSVSEIDKSFKTKEIDPSKYRM